MEVASKVYLRNDVTPWPRYKKILELFYNAEMQQLDFSKSAQSVQAMNSWVSKATHGHIDSMIDESELILFNMLTSVTVSIFQQDDEVTVYLCIFNTQTDQRQG